MTKSNLGKKGFIWFTLLRHSPTLKGVSEGTPGRDLETGTDAEGMEEHGLLACSLPAQHGTTRSGLDPPTPRRCPTDGPTGQSDGGSSSVVVPCSQMTLTAQVDTQNRTANTHTERNFLVDKGQQEEV